MSVEVRELDEQHRHLFDLVDRIGEAAAKSAYIENDLLLLLSDVVDYAMYHLSTEEECMDRFDCRYPAHIEAHLFFRKTLRDFMTKVEDARLNRSPDAVRFAAELAEFTGTWHVEHILTMDKHYTQCFHEHGFY